MLVVENPKLHTEGLAGIENKPHVIPPILAAKLIVRARFDTHRADPAIVNALKLFYNKSVILVMQPKERSNVIFKTPIHNIHQ
jgi:hypothetical protein